MEGLWRGWADYWDCANVYTHVGWDCGGVGLTTGIVPLCTQLDNNLQGTGNYFFFFYDKIMKTPIFITRKVCVCMAL